MNTNNNNEMLAIKDIEKLENTSFASAFANTAEGADAAAVGSGILAICFDTFAYVCVNVEVSDGSCGCTATSGTVDLTGKFTFVGTPAAESDLDLLRAARV